MKHFINLFALIVFSFDIHAEGNSYINYLHIHELVRETGAENTRQETIRNNQSVVGVAETNNKKGLDYFKEKYKTARSRLNSLGLIIEAGSFLTEAYPLFKSIKSTQESIVELVVNNPEYALVAAKSEIVFVEKAESLIRFLTGLAVSVGDLNKMETSDRKILFDFATSELRQLDGQAYTLLVTLNQLEMTNGNFLDFSSWVNEDKDIIKEIMTNIEAL